MALQQSSAAWLSVDASRPAHGFVRRLKVASAQPVRLTRDNIRLKLFLALAAERQSR
jgi:hypothetical protein